MAAGRLGCAEETIAFVTFQCGAPRTCTLTNSSSITWNRILDGISEAEVIVPIAVGAGRVNPCCDCLADIEPWCTELHIMRDGVLVWSGPVLSVDYGYNSVTIKAQDVLGWLNERVPQGVFSNADSPFEITDLGLDVLEAAFAEHDPCVLRWVYQTDVVQGTRPTYLGPISVDSSNFSAFDGTYYDWLTHLSDIGLDYTVIGRRIVLGVDSADLPVAGTLTDEHILGEVSVKKDGSLMVNRAFIRYKDDDDSATCSANAKAGGSSTFTVPCPAIVNGTSQYCYGPIEKVFSDANAFNIGTAKALGQLYVDAGSICPRTVEFPAGSKLSPNAPFDINELVPGSKIRIAFAGLCLEVFQEFKLLEVGFTLGDGGNEEITVSLGPLNSPGTSGG